MEASWVRRFELGLGCLAASVTAVAALPQTARACGGLFCSSANPVNQAAEQIIFVDNPDDTVTAVIQIQYEGPSQKFAWVLPVPGTPTIRVSADAALDAVKQATNPQYQLQTRMIDGCDSVAGSDRSSPNRASTLAPRPEEPGVVVRASGAIGPYDYSVIEIDAQAADPARRALDWLTDNGYDVGALGPDVLRPYLEEGLNLLAFKLTKGSNTGSIRPVMITYAAKLASIPIRPTAVAANEDMGVLVYVLSDARAIPQNYKALELNEALIDWFNPMNTYNAVVSKAADEAMGQGFVTEFASPHKGLFAIFDARERQRWQAFTARVFATPLDRVLEAITQYGVWQGFNDALSAAVTLPESVRIEDFKLCPRCYFQDPGVALDEELFLLKMNELVIAPMADTQALFDSRPYLTRLYTTMSPDEMTIDPAFAINPDLAPVSNVHLADNLLDCEGRVFQVELPSGDSVRGTEVGTWPLAVAQAPAALKIMQYGTSGPGRVVEDQSVEVSRAVSVHNRKVPEVSNGSCAAAPRSAASASAYGALALWLAAIVLLAQRRSRLGLKRGARV